MSGEGYIKLHRQVFGKEYYQNSKYVHLWVHLLLKANHKEASLMWDGGVISLKPGQFITGRKQLSDETGISETTIERILEHFEKVRQIGQQKTNKFRIISIQNWGKYQMQEEKVDNKRTTNGQQTDTNKNDKNDKNDNNIAKNKFFAPHKIREIVNYYLELTGKDEQEYKKHLRSAKELLTLCDEDIEQAKKILDKCKRSAIGEWSIYWAVRKYLEFTSVIKTAPN